MRFPLVESRISFFKRTRLDNAVLSFSFFSQAQSKFGSGVVVKLTFPNVVAFKLPNGALEIKTEQELKEAAKKKKALP